MAKPTRPSPPGDAARLGHRGPRVLRCVALKPVDQAGAYTDLAESYLKSGRRAEARKQVLAALEIAPSYQRAQDLLLAIAEAK